MASLMFRPSRTLLHRLYLSVRPLSLTTQSEKLTRIADELLDLTKLEKYDYSVLFTHKMGLRRYIRNVSALNAAAGAVGGGVAATAPDAAAKAEKTVFDVKLEKFDAVAKIKIIKEVRRFTDLGLKGAKDLVEKAPVVVKKGLTKGEDVADPDHLRSDFFPSLWLLFFLVSKYILTRKGDQTQIQQ